MEFKAPNLLATTSSLAYSTVKMQANHNKLKQDKGVTYCDNNKGNARSIHDEN